MNPQILAAIKKGELVLFMGAGASFGSLTAAGNPIAMSDTLARKLAEAAKFVYEGESLDVVYEAARQQLGRRIDEILEENFRHVVPSAEYNRLSKYVWRRIYTLNIDDGLDHALLKNSPQKVSRRLIRSPVAERNQFFEVLDYIKLNGSSDQLSDGIIFSPSEYAQATVKGYPWYSQCASDFIRSAVLFIGTTINEPLLKFHIERYQSLNSEPLGTSYLIAKSATQIQIASLKRYNIEFIEGTIRDFADWLERELPVPPATIEVACESIPQLRAMVGSRKREAYADLFEHVTAVNQDLVLSNGSAKGSAIRDFYKGFKPQWDDIVDGVPAELEVLDAAVKRVDVLEIGLSFLPILGPAGSGKTTLLMQLAWHFSRSVDWSVYFIDAVPSSLLATMLAIEESSPNPMVLVIIDNVEFFTEQLDIALKSGKLNKTIIVSAERENVWNRRAKTALATLYKDPLLVSQFTERDAIRILEKLQQFGSWTRLGKMRQRDRIKELIERSKKQLLIALLEATLGRGFEKIIEDEYAQIALEDERLFLVCVAIATDRRCDAPVALIDRALDKMSILRRVGGFVEDLAGIVHLKRGGLSARHPVYAKYLLDRVVDPVLAAKAVNGMLQAFADYQAPVIQNLPKSESVLYKGLINHKFLFELLNGSKRLIIPTYSQLEKRFERDGLFWLQYGLALRDFEEHDEALEKLRIAYEAYPMPHTQHALAQQLLQVALIRTDKSLALGLAEQAKVMLERLDDVIDSDDTYPIVTLAEDYTKVLIKHSSKADAKKFASAYSIILGQRAKLSPERGRLKTAYERLFKFSATGVWTDQDD
jgi:hypothetical protein